MKEREWESRVVHIRKEGLGDRSGSGSERSA